MEAIIGAIALNHGFTEFIDIGTITVPSDFDPEKRLKATYFTQHGLPELSTNRDFPLPVRVLLPGESFHVWAFQQNGWEKTTTAERLAFLATKRAIHSAQGMAYIFEQKGNLLPNGYDYTLFHQTSVTAGGSTSDMDCVLSLRHYAKFTFERNIADDRFKQHVLMLCISPLD